MAADDKASGHPREAEWPARSECNAGGPSRIQSGMQGTLGRAAAIVAGCMLAACASAPRPAPAPTVAAAAAPAVAEPTLAGAWQGALVLSSLRLALRIERTGASWTAALDSLDQGAHDIRADSVKVDGDAIDIAFPRINARYLGQVKNGALTGTWLQNGRRPLDLERQAGGPTAAAGPAGTWRGTLQVRLTVVLHLQRDGAGWSATADSPDQHVAGVPIGGVTVTGNAVVFALPRMDASYSARVEGDRMVGVFTQHGRAIPLELARTDHPPAVASRPQEPRRPLPYEELDITVPGGAKDVTLACTLTKPTGAGPFAAVVLATGSGPQDRDESLMGHKPFLVLSDALTRAGLEVLRCDDRGVGASTGTFAAATTLDFANDALAAVAALRARPDVARDRVGIVGHSEGATVAAIGAATSPDVAFIVMLAGPALPGRDIEHLQRAWTARHAGASESDIAEARAKWDEAYAIVAMEPDDAAARSRLRALYDGLPAEARAGIERGGGFETAAAQLLAPWHRAFLTLDPRTYLARVRVPVLALDGERDMQVPPDANLPELRKALAGDRDVTIDELPGLNHLFQSATTGAPSEYGEIAETMSPAALTVIRDWLLRRAR
jgi:pimeloyl-ACP methyl ester carboxylesterase